MGEELEYRSPALGPSVKATEITLKSLPTSALRSLSLSKHLYDRHPRPRVQLVPGRGVHVLQVTHRVRADAPGSLDGPRLVDGPHLMDGRCLMTTSRAWIVSKGTLGSRPESASCNACRLTQDTHLMDTLKMRSFPSPGSVTSSSTCGGEAHGHSRSP